MREGGPIVYVDGAWVHVSQEEFDRSVKRSEANEMTHTDGSPDYTPWLKDGNENKCAAMKGK